MIIRSLPEAFGVDAFLTEAKLTRVCYVAHGYVYQSTARRWVVLARGDVGSTTNARHSCHALIAANRPCLAEDNRALHLPYAHLAERGGCSMRNLGYTRPHSYPWPGLQPPLSR
jgi:hypothetical protein